MTQTSSGYGELPPSGGGGINVRRALESFKRQIPIMIVVFVVLAALGWYIGGKAKRTYSAESRLMVTLGEEYVYQSSTGRDSSNGGLVTTPDSVTLNEIGILTSSDLMDQVISMTGMQKLFPKKYGKWRQSNPGLEKSNLKNEMIKEFEEAFAAAAKPKSSIIDIKFEHENPAVATEVLSNILVIYKEKRKELFVEGVSEQLAESRLATEEQLATVERAISRFMSRNGIADFDSERGGARKRLEDLRAEQNTLLASMREAEAALMSTEDSLRRTPPTIDLQVDDRASQRVAQAELERKQLLAKYLPTSDPVRAKEREISELRQLIASNGGVATGGRRVGPNTVYQNLMTERNKFQAQADSFREKAVIIQRQLDAAKARTARLSAIAPELANLIREKESVEERLSSLNLREQNALVAQQTQMGKAENVKVIAAPGPARKGRNMKKIIQILSVAGAGMTALMIGLLGTFLDSRIYGPKTGRAMGTSRGNVGYNASDNASDAYIPEAVPAYSTFQPQQPAYAPAAANAGSQYGDYNQADYQTSYTNVDQYSAAAPYQEHAYAQPAQMHMHDPMQATGTGGYMPQPYSPQSYGASYGDDTNPYAMSPPVPESQTPYPQGAAPQTVGAQEAVQFVEGPNGEMIPIIGQPGQTQ